MLTKFLFSYFFLQIAIFWKNGIYHPVSFIWLTISFILFLLCFKNTLNKSPSWNFSHTRILGSLILILTFIQFFRKAGNDIELSIYHFAYYFILILVISYIVFLIYHHVKGTNPTKGKWLFLVILLGIFILKLGIIVLSSPVIDVWRVLQEASDHFIKGEQIYRGDYTNIYLERLGVIPDFQKFNGMLYFPTIVYVQFIFKTILGDVRYAHLFAEITCSILIFKFIRTDPILRFFILIAFLLNPRSLFVLQQCWFEPIIVLFFYLSFYLLYKNDNTKIGNFLLGVTYSFKQSLLPLLLYDFILCIKKQSHHFKWVLLGITLPFVSIFFYGIEPFYQNTLQPILENNTRAHFYDSLSFHAFTLNAWGWTLPTWMILIISMSMPLFILFKKSFTHCDRVFIYITYFFIAFYFERSFMNYFYLVGQLMLLYIIILSQNNKIVSNPN